MSASVIRVLLVDDDALMRAGLASILSSDPTLDVVGETAATRWSGSTRCGPTSS